MKLLILGSTIFVSFLTLLNSCSQMTVGSMDDQWLVSMQEYEGFPLGLRIRRNTDSIQLQSRFIKRIVVTHKLEKVTESGLPEPEYNLAIMDFDIYLSEYFENTNEGITVLIETYGGERNYYLYVLQDASEDKMLSEVKSKYPTYDITVSSKLDKDWTFLEEYRKQFPW